jgi:hypothetical protein
MIDVNLSAKRGSATAVATQLDQHLPIVEMDIDQHHLNGATHVTTSNGNNNENKVQEIINNAANEFTESPPIDDDDGNV